MRYQTTNITTRAKVGLIGLILVVAFYWPAIAKIGPVSLEQAVKQSTGILLGKVKKICDVNGSKVAEIEVTRALKGCMAGDIFFVYAAPTWACDISCASEGETDIMLLTTDCPIFKPQEKFAKAFAALAGEKNLHFFVHSGGGRIQVNGPAAEQVGEVNGYINLPESLQTAKKNGDKTLVPFDTLWSTLKERVEMDEK